MTARTYVLVGGPADGCTITLAEHVGNPHALEVSGFGLRGAYHPADFFVVDYPQPHTERRRTWRVWRFTGDDTEPDGDTLAAILDTPPDTTTTTRTVPVGGTTHPEDPPCRS